MYEAFEKVNPAHPDKVADRIAGALVDLAYKKQNDPKIAVEVLLGHGRCTIIAESSVEITALEAAAIVERISGIRETNFTLVPQDEHLAANQAKEIRCGDNGIFKGVPTDSVETTLTELAHELYDKYHSDGKYILAANDLYPNFINGDREKEFYVCQSNAKTEDLVKIVKKYSPLYRINPLGEWTGGSDADCGATNRKLGSDMGRGATGGGLHGKDLSKADVAINIYCHLEAEKYGCAVYAHCPIGAKKVYIKYSAETCDHEYVNYSEIVEIARKYIGDCGGFEKFAEWGIIR